MKAPDWIKAEIYLTDTVGIIKYDINNIEEFKKSLIFQDTNFFENFYYSHL